ncbi:MAG: 4Fe-4S cluster-binding domain-containing protein [Paludibacteraceae bacterium]|nr:4Fe-4S cluster-binding domain-containing protein [Paludibacteraceae bacterium]
MLKVASFDIVFQEIPGEVTLALNLSGCPCHCPGCHSPHLWEDIGEELNAELLSGLLDRYGSMITCVAFMGGDQAPEEVAQWAEYIKSHSCNLSPFPSGVKSSARSGVRWTAVEHWRCEASLRTAWYSGRPHLPECLSAQRSVSAAVCTLSDVIGPFDYIKLGPYIESLGGLKSEKTNQRLYKRVGQGTPESPYEWQDITSLFWKNRFE